MDACKPIILVDQLAFCIAQCQHCQRVGLTFHNLMLGFTQDEFVALCRTLEPVNFDQCSTPLQNGQASLIIKTGHPDIQFSLSRSEFDSFRAGLTQALRRMNLYQQLRSQSN